MKFKKSKIGVNDLCPCGSGKKYKRCHGGIDPVPVENPGALDSRMRKLAPNPVCLVPNSLKLECRGKIISSHTVSRSGSLGLIEKNGHVYSFKVSVQNLQAQGGRIKPHLTGWKTASTFPGFCAHHDKSVFSPLEDKEFTGSPQQCFLLSYRAVIWEYYSKLKAANSSPFRQALAQPKDKFSKELISDFNAVNDLALNDMSSRKVDFENKLVENDWSDFHGILIEFDRVFPIQCSAFWSPAEDIFGNQIQNIGVTAKVPAGGAIASFAADKKSYFLLSWLKNSDHVLAKFADSLQSVSKNDAANVIAAFLLLTSDNCHISPAWYNALTEHEKNWVNQAMHPITSAILRTFKHSQVGPIKNISAIKITRF